ncbi:MAG TPA: hypothetical protein VKF81_07835 [Blastocatellia bacterium]|nr:hypothetical protein [Blastocatellia bacterium]
MIALIVILFVALAGAALTLYLWQRTSNKSSAELEIEPRRFAGLFADRRSSAASASAKAKTDTSQLRANLIGRARDGDLTTLSEASSSRDTALYGEVLDALIDSAYGSQEKLSALVNRISNSNELRANKQLAEQVLATWKAAPDRRSTTEMIHVAALSDDAEVYQQAIELVTSFWQQGKLREFRGEELVELFNSQYWILAHEARRGGAGFALKRKLAGVRRELAAATPAR